MQTSNVSAASSVSSYSTSVEKLEQNEARAKGKAETRLIEDAGAVSKDGPQARNAGGVGRSVDVKA